MSKIRNINVPGGCQLGRYAGPVENGRGGSRKNPNDFTGAAPPVSLLNVVLTRFVAALSMTAFIGASATMFTGCDTGTSMGGPEKEGGNGKDPFDTSGPVTINGFKNLRHYADKVGMESIYSMEDAGVKFDVGSPFDASVNVNGAKRRLYDQAESLVTRYANDKSDFGTKIHGYQVSIANNYIRGAIEVVDSITVTRHAEIITEMAKTVSDQKFTQYVEAFKKANVIRHRVAMTNTELNAANSEIQKFCSDNEITYNNNIYALEAIADALITMVDGDKGKCTLLEQARGFAIFEGLVADTQKLYSNLIVMNQEEEDTMGVEKKTFLATMPTRKQEQEKNGLYV